jgi:hypothetical protein
MPAWLANPIFTRLTPLFGAGRALNLLIKEQRARAGPIHERFTTNLEGNDLTPPYPVRTLPDQSGTMAVSWGC